MKLSVAYFRPSPQLGAFVLALLLAHGTLQAAPELTQTVQFDIAPQRLTEALIKYSEQSGIQISSPTALVNGKSSAGVAGKLGAGEALSRLLQGTNLRYSVVDQSTVAIQAVADKGGQATDAQSTGAPRRSALRSLVLARAETAVQPDTTSSTGAETADASASDAKGVPEILVKGSRSSNTDIRRTADDVQPYVVFGAEEIKRSMATDLESFLKYRLPMNQVQATEAQLPGNLRGNQSSINLRGLGTDETLVLVNGRRVPSVAGQIDQFQPDINGIPLSSVERIEVLPSTAGGIYGGSATGGVVNIILKRDYQGLEVRGTYHDTMDGGGMQRGIEASGGFSLEGGRTNVMIAASYRGSEPLRNGDRDFALRARHLLIKNNEDGFGSVPPAGYTTNIRTTDGSPLVLKSTMQSLGYPNAYVPLGYEGPDSDDGAAFLQTAGHYNLDLPLDHGGALGDLVSNPTVRSLSLSVRREFSGRVEAFIDASNNDNRGNSYYSPWTTYTLSAEEDANPFMQSVSITVPFVGFDHGVSAFSRSRTRQINGGVIVRLPRGWTMQAEYNWSRSSGGGTYTSNHITLDGDDAITDGRLNPLRDVNVYPLNFSPYLFEPSPNNSGSYNNVLKDATLRLAGPVWDLPGGQIILSSLLEQRKEFTDDSTRVHYDEPNVPTYHYYPPFGATTESVYVEVIAPLVSALNARSWVRALDLQASYRFDRSDIRHRSFDDYEVVRSSLEEPLPDIPTRSLKTDANQYTVGLRFKPIRALTLRASYGKGILPPSVSQLAPLSGSAFLINIFSQLIQDPKRGYAPISSLQNYTFAGSFDLTAEESESLSAGLIFEPSALPGLRLSLDYTRIRKTNEISSVPLATMLAFEDEGFASRILRGALTEADEVLGYTRGPILAIDNGNINIAHSDVDAYDLQADYVWETAYGSFAANIIASYQPHLMQQVFSDTPEYDLVGYGDGPLKWRGNGGLSWSRGSWTAGWNMQYFHSYKIYNPTDIAFIVDSAILDQGSDTIPRQSYHDVFARYRFDAPAFDIDLLRNAEIQVSIQNVFDSSPPILATSSAGGGYSFYGDPRLRRYSISVSKSFQ